MSVQSVERSSQRLSGYRRRSYAVFHGWEALFMGAGLLGMGGYVAYPVRNHVRWPFNPDYIGYWIIAALGAFMALAGLYLAVHGTLGIRRRARLRARQARRPSEPWAWDFAWDAREATDDTRAQAMRALRYVAGTLAVLGPVNWVLFAPDSLLLGLVVVGVMDLVALGLAGRAAYLFARLARQGTTMLRFGRFPFHLGGRFEASFVAPRGLDGAEALHVTLRCVEEVYETYGAGQRRRKVVVCYQRWAASRNVPLAGGLGSLVRADGVPLSLELPPPADDDGVPTRLSNEPPAYWELEVNAKRPGIDLHAVFLVPVYEPTAAAA